MSSARELLSAREVEVVELVAQGLSTREIADHLVLSFETVKTHLRNIFRKCGVRRRAELVALWCDRRQSSEVTPDAPTYRGGQVTREGQWWRQLGMSGLALTAITLLLAMMPLVHGPNITTIVTPDNAESVEIGRSRSSNDGPEPSRRRAAGCEQAPSALRASDSSLCETKFAPAQELPAIGIVSPSSGADVVGPRVTVEVEVTDFVLVPPTGTDAKPGEGHIIYYLDFEPVFVPGQPAIPTDPEAIYAASEQTNHTFEDVERGSHEVFVLLVHDDHTPLIPPAITGVSFIVIAPTETPVPKPSPAAREEGRSVFLEEATPSPTIAVLPTAALPAEIPTGGGLPAGLETKTESGVGPITWLLAGAAVGTVAIIAGLLTLQMRRRTK